MDTFVKRTMLGQTDTQSCFLPFFTPFSYNTIQYKFYYQLPMGAFQRQVLIVQVIKKKKKKKKKRITNLLSRKY